MKNSRDNFPRTVALKLERRVNGHCSNPDCRVSTSGPSLGKDSANSIGIAAHIAAAAPSGPRYDERQSIEERKSISNGIWLCSNCATRIDKDEKRYTVELLHHWKRQAEQDALDEMGFSPISRRSYDVVKSIALGEPLKSNVASAVQEICRLSADELTKIDPRFVVDVEYKNKRTVYTLRPQVDIDCSVTVDAPYAEEFLRKYSDLVDHGAALEIDMEALRLDGTPLFGIHNGTQGKLVFEPTNTRNAVCKVSIEGCGQRISLDDIKGSITGGKKSIKFVGDAFEGCLSLELVVDFSNTSGSSSAIKLYHRYSFWGGKSIFSLPYFSRLYHFYEAAAQKRLMQVSLEMDGEEVVCGKSADLLKDSDSQATFKMLRYIRNVRGVAGFIGADVLFKNGVKISAEDANRIEEFYNMIVELPKMKGADIGNIEFNISTQDDLSEGLSKLTSGEAFPIHLVQNSSMLNMFGDMVEIPKINISYSSMRLVTSSNSTDGEKKISLAPEAECVVNVYLAEGSSDVQNS